VADYGSKATVEVSSGNGIEMRCIVLGTDRRIIALRVFEVDRLTVKKREEGCTISSNQCNLRITDAEPPS
jgi:hypothetical protein